MWDSYHVIPMSADTQAVHLHSLECMTWRHAELWKKEYEKCVAWLGDMQSCEREISIGYHAPPMPDDMHAVHLGTLTQIRDWWLAEL